MGECLAIIINYLVSPLCPSLLLPYHSLQDMGPTSMPSVPLMVGCGVSCTALLILLLIYAAFWRYTYTHKHILDGVMPVYTHTSPAQTVVIFLIIWAPTNT